MKSPFGKLSKLEDKPQPKVQKPDKMGSGGGMPTQEGISQGGAKKPIAIGQNTTAGLTQAEVEKKKAEEAKLQKKEETSEERFTKVRICEEESTNLDRVFELFVNEQKKLAREGKGKKEIGKSDKGSGQVKIEDIDWFDSKSVRSILNELGVKEIREHDIEIMIWVRKMVILGSRREP